MGKARPGDMGMDVVHMNLHKTFSTPHGGGGPGAGPVAVNDRLEPYLPLPLVATDADGGSGFTLDHDRPHSIGRVHGLLRQRRACWSAPTPTCCAWAATGSPAPPRTRCSTPTTCAPACSDVYDVPHDRLNMHEFVASASRQKQATGVTARDIAKRILDFGMHAPTVYFPLIVHEAMMIEPTETEDLPSLDAFVAVMRRIAAESADDPAVVLEAPHTTPVRRPDETLAARRPVLRWVPEEG